MAAPDATVPQGQWCWAHVRVWVPYRILKEAVREAEAGLAYKPPGVPDMEEVMVPLVGGLVYTYCDLSLLVRLDLL